MSLEQHEQLIRMTDSVIGPVIWMYIFQSITISWEKPANPLQRGVCPKPVKPEAKTKEFEKKLERGEVETVIEGEGALVKEYWSPSRGQGEGQNRGQGPKKNLVSEVIEEDRWARL